MHKHNSQTCKDGAPQYMRTFGSIVLNTAIVVECNSLSEPRVVEVLLSNMGSVDTITKLLSNEMDLEYTEYMFIPKSHRGYVRYTWSMSYIPTTPYVPPFHIRYRAFVEAALFIPSNGNAKFLGKCIVFCQRWRRPSCKFPKICLASPVLYMCTQILLLLQICIQRHIEPWGWLFHALHRHSKFTLGLGQLFALSTSA